jgi:hypothetical protein
MNTNAPLPNTTRRIRNATTHQYTFNPPPDPPKAPLVLHYCQHYQWGETSFYKYTVPKGLWQSCDVDLLPKPSATKKAADPKDKLQVRNRWTLCTLIPFLNEAFRFFKKRHCSID